MCAWELASGAQIAELALDALDLAVFPDSRHVLVGCRERTVVVDLEAAEVVDEWEGGAREVGLLGAARFAVGILPERLRVRDLRDDSTVFDQAYTDGEDRLLALAVAPDGRSFVVGTITGRLLRFRLEGLPS